MCFHRSRASSGLLLWTTSSLSSWSCFYVWSAIVSISSLIKPLWSVALLGTFNSNVSVVTSFVISLSQRRDATFFLCGEECKYINRLCFRIYQPDTVPLKRAWLLLMDFRLSQGKLMSDEDFLVRLKIASKVTTASNLKAAGLHFNKKSSKAAINKTAESAKSDFVGSARDFIKFLLSGVLQHTELGSDLIKGLAAFDPHILFRRPVEVALRHFDRLHSTFQLRSWVSASNESVCRDEYVALLDYLRANHFSEFSSASDPPDLIDFFMDLEFLQTREHLCYLFKLSCLCITSVSTEYPSVSLGRIDTKGLQSRLVDVILPCQSYLSTVPDSLVACCTKSRLEKFSELSSSFGQSAFAPDYDPWTYVDGFGRAAIYKTLVSSYRSVLSGTEFHFRSPGLADTSSVRDAPAVKLPSDSKRRRIKRSCSRSRASSVAEESPADVSKN